MPDESIKQYHLQLMQKAASSVKEHSVDQRDMQSLIFAFDKKKMKMIKKEIVSFIEHIDRTYGTEEGNADSIYVFGIQFFPLA